MPLPVNSHLGPYEIKSQLGAGGMGEVYRAYDSRLDRDVAIKVLRTDGTGTSDLRSRFEGEARAVAALNHPNIVAVYDFGIEQGQQYIVSELIDGESLRSLLRGKVVPARKLVDIATQVADGLAAAHAAGIVHRDLKPENIMIARDGRVKILDFGLARQARPSSILAANSHDETIAGAPGNRDITGEGVVIGTPNYMSPEQALGRELDYHSDQFSFGLILYELASGKQAFARNSTIETMAAIVREEPAPMDEKLPPPLRWIIDRCLAKEAGQRYESTLDLYRDLKNLRDHFSEAYSSGSFPQAPAAPSSAKYQKLIASCLACIVLTALLVYALKPPGQDVGAYRYKPYATDASRAIWSPDGTAVTYAGKVNGIYQAFVRYQNSPASVQLTHGSKVIRPIGWSGDQSHILVFERATDDWSSGRILALATVGGDPEFLMDAGCIACDLSRNGNAFTTFARTKDGSWTLEVSDPLGSPLVPYPGAPFVSRNFYNVPIVHFSPDGREILLIRSGDHNKRESWLLPYPAGVQPPRLVFTSIASSSRSPSFSWMPDNRHVIVSVSGEGQNTPLHLWMADTLSDRIEPMTSGTVDELYPAVSPDGKSILLNQANENAKVVSMSIPDGSTESAIDVGRMDTMASWSTRQKRLVWVTNRRGPWEIWLRSEGSERPLVTDADFLDGPTRRFLTPSLSPDGERVIFSRAEASGVLRLWISSLSGGTPVRLTNRASSVEFGGAWSPDASRFVYMQSVQEHVTLTIARTTGGATPINLIDIPQNKGQSVSLPAWSPTGEWITLGDGTDWKLISPDGRSFKTLGKIDTPYLVFSTDGKNLYGLETGTATDGKISTNLVRVEVATLKKNVIREIASDFRPNCYITPCITFSMGEDGKSFLYPVYKQQYDLWMLEGFRQPGWLDRFSLH